MILKVVKRAIGKDARTGNNQMDLDLYPGVLSELNHSKLHPLPFKFLKSKKKIC